MDEALTEQVRTAMPFAATLGLEVIAASTEEVRTAIEWEDRLTTAAGILHGGVLMGLADTAGAFCWFVQPARGRDVDGDDRVEDEFFLSRSLGAGRGALAAAPRR